MDAVHVVDTWVPILPDVSPDANSDSRVLGVLTEVDVAAQHNGIFGAWGCSPSVVWCPQVPCYESIESWAELDKRPRRPRKHAERTPQSREGVRPPPVADAHS